VAAALGRSAPCPVLVAPQPDHTLPAPSRLPFVDVLCVVDFTASSDAALRVGIGLVECGGGRLTLVHVVEGWSDRTMLSASGALRRLRAYQARAAGDKQRLRGLIPPRALDPSRVEPLVVTGPLPRAILRAASETRPDLVVMGVTPRSAGSAARVILRRTTCPVLLFPAPEPAARVDTLASRDARHGVGWIEPSPDGLVHQMRA
jgi:nucleotide-binding universal stress UspA family protein